MPMDAEVILKRFDNHTTQQDGDAEIDEYGDGDSWIELRNLFDSAVANSAGNDGLRDALNTKTKHEKLSKTLNLQQRKEYHGGATFWSPRKIREGRAREVVKQREEEAEKLCKANDKQLREAALLYKKQLQAAAKEARGIAKVERKKQADAKAQRLAKSRALKQQEQQRDAATSQKSHDTLNKGKRKASPRTDHMRCTGTVVLYLYLLRCS
jgi:hypothetical protein